MSAVNITIEPHRALIATDAAVYGADGRLTMFRDKCEVTANGRIVVTGRGNAFFAPLVARYLSRSGLCLDEVIADGGALIEALHAEAEPLMLEHVGQARNDVFIVGWSALARAPKIVQWTNVPPDGVPCFSLAGSVLAPETSPAADARIMQALGPQRPDTMDYERFLIEVTKAQRFDTGAAKYGLEHSYSVGGHIQIAEVTARGVTKRIVHRWPEDRIGEVIRPLPDLDPVAHPNVTAMPMNRADRRRLEKAQRKGVA